MSKLSKIAVVSIEPHNLRVCSKADDDGLQAFSALRPVCRPLHTGVLTAVRGGTARVTRAHRVASCGAQDVICSDYRVESRANNCISLQMNMGNLVKAFRSATHTALSIVVRLTKKALIPYLTVDIIVRASCWSLHRPPRHWTHTFAHAYTNVPLQYHRLSRLSASRKMYL